MKKMIATALALTLCLCMGTTALAADVNGAGLGAQDPIDVTAKYNDGATTPTVYSVDLKWDDMTFTYNASGTRTWNPDTHTYTDTTSAGWDKTTAEVTATNHSNAAVNVTVAYAQTGDYGVTGTLSNANFTLAAGVEGNYANAASDKATLTISGTPNSTVTAEGVTVGTITVTIS